VFDLWITEWRLGILDQRQAASVLKLVLRDLGAKGADDPFWKFLRQFLEPSDADIETRAPEGVSETARLLDCACSLYPQRAKLLLEHLGRFYAFDGDDLQFWGAVSEAIELSAVSSSGTCRLDSC